MVEITDEELQSLNRVILTRYGIDFTSYEPSSFKRRVSRAISVYKLESVLELWSKLLKDRDFIYPFIDELTVGLTAMFRDPVLWTTLKKSALKNFQEQSQITIWHAGCSTGEEVFTMGVVLQDAGLLEKAKALATDLNQKALKQAKEGKYHIQVIDEYIKNYKEYNPIRKFDNYYTTAGEQVQFDLHFNKHVQYKHHNLVMEPVSQKFDIIFCRNVMIYFDHTTKLRLLEQFHQSLNESGYFIIGFYDALMPLINHKKFEIVDIHAKIFRKI